MTDRADGSSGDPLDTIVSRRDLLVASGAGFASALGGCSSDGETPTDESSPTTTSTATATRTPTAGDPTTTPEHPTTTPTSSSQSGFDASFLRTSPSSHVAPTDGFADVGWLEGSEPAIVRVTTLASEGEGSLRRALRQPGTRIVVFEVGGVIDLEGQSLQVETPEVYVAGQTAPSPGVTLVRGGLGIDADDVLLQHIRVRPGDEIPAPTDAIGNGGSNVIVDHCTASWGTDEGLSTNAGEANPDVTFSNNMVVEGLHDSIHPKGPHSMGTLVMDRSKRVTIAGNLWAHNVGRHPRLKGGTTTVVTNNVVYDYDRGTNLGGGVEDETVSSVVGNHYRAGTITDETQAVVGTTFTDASGDITTFLAYNATDPSTMPVTRDEEALGTSTSRPLWPEGLENVGGDDAYEMVLSSVGARPAARDHHDERIVTDVRERTGAPIDSQSDVGGYPDPEPVERSLDIPDTDVASWLDQHTVAVETGST